MIYFFLNIALALVWVALTGGLSLANLLMGFGLGYLILAATQLALVPSPYFQKAWQAFGFALFFLWELILSNLRVAHDVLTPRHRMQPRVIAVPLDARNDTEITMLANLITLTPGTLSLDVSTDRRVIYIHAMYAADAEAARREIKDGLERRLLVLLSNGRR